MIRFKQKNIDSNNPNKVITYYWQRASPAPLDPDAVAFLTAAGITDPTISGSINTLVTDLKLYGLWTKMKAIYPFVGGTATTHKFNLKDPRDLDVAFRLVFVGGWTHFTTGTLPNGTNAYADTYFNAVVQSLSLSSVNLSIYQRQDSIAGTSRAKMGSADTDAIVNGFGLGFFSTGSVEVGVVGSTGGAQYSPSSSSPASKGLFMINTIGNRNAQHWKNGVKNGLAVGQSGSFSNRNIWVGAMNTNTINPYYFNREIAFASIGDGLTDTEATNYYTAVQAFQTTLGRQV
jgi:hypothetical protein